MSIHIILGKPGSGKSRYATGDLVKQLRETNRNIVTNLPLRLGRLNEYLQQRYPKDSIDVVGRVRVMSDDEMRNFWRYRGPDLRSEYDDVTQTDQDKRFGDDRGRGVAYYLDEAHIAFNARDWAVLGRDAIHYMSQHRKLGDLVFPITQAVGNLDKQFRSVAEDYTVLRNEAVLKLGPFRGAARFKFRRYYSEPTNNAEPYETGTFSLDKDGLASCYDTAKGIGVHGSMADIGRRAKGISIYWVFPIVMAVAAACVFLPMALGHLAGSYISGSKAKEVQGAGAKGAPDTGHPEGAREVVADYGGRNSAGGIERSQVLGRTNGTTPPPPQQVWVVGAVVYRGKYNLVLSDGRRLSEQDGLIAHATRNYIEMKDGQRYWWKGPVQDKAVAVSQAVNGPNPVKS